MNQISVVGRLTAKPELMTGQTNGREWVRATCSIAEKRYGLPDVQFFRLTVWGKSAQNFAGWGDKGMSCCVFGELKIDQKGTNGDNAKTYISIDVRDFKFFPKEQSRLTDGAGQEFADHHPGVAAANTASAPEPSLTFDDDIPF